MLSRSTAFSNDKLLLLLLLLGGDCSVCFLRQRRVQDMCLVSLFLYAPFHLKLAFLLIGSLPLLLRKQKKTKKRKSSKRQKEKKNTHCIC